MYVLKTQFSDGYDRILDQRRNEDPLLNTYSDPDLEARRVAEIYGLTSFIIWLLIIIPCIKYVTFILQADHFGQGGTFSLVSLIPTIYQNPSIKKRFREVMFIIAMFG